MEIELLIYQWVKDGQLDSETNLNRVRQAISESKELKALYTTYQELKKENILVLAAPTIKEQLYSSIENQHLIDKVKSGNTNLDDWNNIGIKLIVDDEFKNSYNEQITYIQLRKNPIIIKRLIKYISIAASILLLLFIGFEHNKNQLYQLALTDKYENSNINQLGGDDFISNICNILQNNSLRNHKKPIYIGESITTTVVQKGTTIFGQKKFYLLKENGCSIKVLTTEGDLPIEIGQQISLDGYLILISNWGQKEWIIVEKVRHKIYK